MSRQKREAWMTTDSILDEIRLLQNIQKAHPQSHPEWKKASGKLAELYEEMARREAFRNGSAA
jgi:hypothetical protein